MGNLKIILPSTEMNACKEATFLSKFKNLLNFQNYTNKETELNPIVHNASKIEFNSNSNTNLSVEKEDHSSSFNMVSNLNFEKDFKEMGNHFPPSLEKDLINLYNDIDSLDDSIENMQKIKNSLEHLLSSPYFRIYPEINKKSIPNDDKIINKSHLKKRITNIFEKINPINSFILTRNLEISKSQIEKNLSHKKIFLLLGLKGVGKSTIMCYLKNCTLNLGKNNRIEVSKDSTISPPCQISHSLNDSPHQLNLIPFRMNVAKGKGFIEKEMVFCDVPGFCDNFIKNEITSEILNSLRIGQLIKCASFVKPIIIISENSIGMRFEKLESFLFILKNFIPKLDCLKKCYYIFSGFEHHNEEEIKNKLEELCQKYYKNHDDNTKKFMVKILKKMKKNSIFLNILEKNPLPDTILQDFIGMKKSKFIDCRNNPFATLLNQQFLEISKKQGEVLEQATLYYFKLKNREMVSLKLNELKIFCDLKLSDSYKKCKHAIAQMYNDNLKEKLEIFKVNLKGDQILKEIDIIEMEQMEEYNFWKDLQADHLSSLLINPDYLKEELEKYLLSLSEIIKNSNFYDKNIANIINNEVLLINRIENLNYEQLFEQNFKKISLELTNIIEKELFDLLNANQLVKISDLLGKIQFFSSQIIFSPHPKVAKYLDFINKSYEKSIQAIISFYNSLIADIGDETNENMDYNETKERLKKLIEIVYKIETLELCSEIKCHINSNLFSEKKDEICKNINYIYLSIKNILTKMEYGYEIKEVFFIIQEIIIFLNQMNLSSKHFGKQIIKEFQTCVKLFFKRLEKDIIDVLQDLLEKKEKIDYLKLNKALTLLSIESQEIKMYIPKMDVLLSDLYETVTCYIQEKEAEFEDFDLKIANFAQIQDVFIFFKQFSHIKKLGNFFEIFNETINNLVIRFLNSAQKNLEVIKNKNYLDFQLIQNQNTIGFDAINYQNLDNSFNYLVTLSKFVKLSKISEFKKLDVDQKLEEFKNKIKSNILNARQYFTLTSTLSDKKTTLALWLKIINQTTSAINFSNEFKIQENLKNYIDLLKDMFFIKREEIKEALDLEIFSEAYIKLRECLNLFIFDEYLADEFKFMKLHQEFSESLNKKVAESVDKAKKHLDENNYQDFQKEYEKLSCSGEIKFLEKISIKLKNYIGSYLKKIKIEFQEFIYIPSHFNNSDLVENNIRKLQKLLGYFEKFDNDLRTIHDNYQKEYANRILEIAKRVERLYKLYKFIAAENQLAHLVKNYQKTIHFISIDYEQCRQEVGDRLIKEIELMSFDNIYEDYLNPKERYEEFQTLISQDTDNAEFYLILKKKFIQAWKTKINQWVKEILNDRSSLIYLKKQLEYFPDAIKSRFEDKIEELLNSQN